MSENFVQFFVALISFFSSTLWRRILQPTAPLHRLNEIFFFLGFLLGGALAVSIAPQAYAGPPPPHGAPLFRLFGGFCVALGTDWANGCTSGHGVCGVPRLSIRSIVAVATFMLSVFVFKYAVDLLV